MMKRLKETFMRTLMEMKTGEGNFVKRINRIVENEKIQMKGGEEKNVQEENKEEKS